MQKMTGYVPNIYLVNINAYKKLVKFCPFDQKILSENQTLTSFKDHNYVEIAKQMTDYNPHLDIVNMNACIKFGESVNLFSRY